MEREMVEELVDAGYACRAACMRDDPAALHPALSYLRKLQLDIDMLEIVNDCVDLLSTSCSRAVGEIMIRRYCTICTEYS